ncbi:MAG: DUF4430 domain-containing protein [Methanomassiliicoccales archaeon]
MIRAIAGKASALALIVGMVALALPFTGCLGGDGGEDEQVTADLTIDFMGERGTIHPGNLTTWYREGGEWVSESRSNGGNTVYVFRNISASDSLEQLERASEVAGFEINKTYYSTMGQWIVDSLDRAENQASGSNWQFWVNGEYASEGAGQVDLKEGDQVEWRYQTNPF